MAAEARVPASVMISLGLHGGALVLFGLLMREAPKAAPKVVEGVDLLIQAPKARPAQAPAAKAPPLSTFDFLKLALPTVPHVSHAAAPAQIKLAEPEHKVKLAAEPRLEDKLKKDMGPKLEPLDMSKEHPIAEQKLDVHVDRRHATQSLAALPRLEDVGRRRVKNLPEAMALEDRRREAVAAVGLPDVAAKATTRHQAAAAVQALQEASPDERPAETRKGLGSLLPERPLALEERPAQAMVPKIEKPAPVAPRLDRAAAAQAEAPKKGVEIEGPLADRRVASYSVPPFPGWAKDQGILEADVKIRFTVDEGGSVMPGMRVESSSGYGRLDKLAMDALATWKFAPKAGAGVQWGVITFRFILE